MHKLVGDRKEMQAKWNVKKLAK